MIFILRSGASAGLCSVESAPVEPGMPTLLRDAFLNLGGCLDIQGPLLADYCLSREAAWGGNSPSRLAGLSNQPHITEPHSLRQPSQPQPISKPL